MENEVEKNKKIFICDDEKNIADLIMMYLESNGFDVEIFGTGEELLNRLKEQIPDLITLDIMLPGKDGFSVLESIRKGSDVPVILVSAKDAEMDKVRGFNEGSDDYIVKPFMPLELVARVKNVLKRVEGKNNIYKKPIKTMLSFSNVKMDTSTMEVFIGKKRISLSKIEYKFFEYMLQNQTKAVTKKDILKEVWGYEEDDNRVIDDLLKRFRKKLDEEKAKVTIETIWGVGYRIVEKK